MADNTREEKDSLGPVTLPADALYGAQTQRAVDNFPISGARMPRGLIEAMGIVKLACAVANISQGRLGAGDDAPKADAIKEAAQQVIDGAVDDAFPIDIYQTGSGTSTNMNANEVIANLASELLGGPRGVGRLVHPNDDVNMSQSSNDTFPSAMHVAARQGMERDLIPALTTLHASLTAKAEEFDDVVKSGRTHLMDATPITLGQEFGGYAHMVKCGRDRVSAASEELSVLALGGTATGTGINCPLGFAALAIAAISDLTGLAFTEAENHFEAQAAKDAFVAAHGALNCLASSLIKIANDIRHLSSGPTSGLSEISLPAVQPGSSIMPGKVNPVMAEALMMACARVMGNHVTITVGASHGNFELNVMMPVMAQAMIESVTVLAGAVNCFATKCVDGIVANRERCRELLMLNPSIATALNTAIGYDAASTIAKKAAKERRSVRDVASELTELTDEELDSYLDVRPMTQPGIPGDNN